MAVYLLTHEENIRLDQSQLVQLYRDCGEERAEQALADAIENIAVILMRLERLGPHGSLTEIADLATQLASYARCCGMVDLARVSEHVKNAAAQIDLAALGATLARLGRIGDHSMAAIWAPNDATV
ncbi:MAG: hypothetical protein OIF40_13525 [Mangrovicoccus sp.]|nr:hypothetical protein [Mangrovicoccus sp.]